MFFGSRVTWGIPFSCGRAVASFPDSQPPCLPLRDRPNVVHNASRFAIASADPSRGTTSFSRYARVAIEFLYPCSVA